MWSGVKKWSNQSCQNIFSMFIYIMVSFVDLVIHGTFIIRYMYSTTLSSPHYLPATKGRLFHIASNAPLFHAYFRLSSVRFISAPQV